jgi:hypothetical protein
MYLMDKSNVDWWYVKNLKGAAGYVPRNFVALQKAPESEEYVFLVVTKNLHG